MEIPAQVAEGLRKRGFRPLKGGLWKRGRRLWTPAVGIASQSWERLLAPLLAEAVLEARALAIESKALPLAVIFAPRLSASMHRRLAEFASRVAPNQDWIAADAQGQVHFHLPTEGSVESIDAVRLLPSPAPLRPVNLFSDLHQWLLKVLLAPAFAPALLTAPRPRIIKSARDLARVAGVSVPATARFVRALTAAGHIDHDYGSIRLVAKRRLLETWLNATERPAHEVGVRALRGRFDASSFWSLLVLGTDDQASRRRTTAGLFWACELLGLGHVRGSPRHLYVERLDAEFLEDMNLVTSGPGDRVDVVLRVPKFPETVFRGAVGDASPATDVLQCWLDVARHPARGEEQAELLWRKVIEPALGRE